MALSTLPSCFESFEVLPILAPSLSLGVEYLSLLISCKFLHLFVSSFRLHGADPMSHLGWELQARSSVGTSCLHEEDLNDDVLLRKEFV